MYTVSVIFGKANDSVHIHFPSKKIDISSRDDNEKTPFIRDRVCRTAIWYQICGNNTIPFRDVTIQCVGGCRSMVAVMVALESYMTMAMVYASGVIDVAELVAVVVHDFDSVDDTASMGRIEMTIPPPFSVRILNNVM